MTGPHEPRRPRSVVVVGAGMAGLTTAWFLRRHGIEVTVVERRHVAAGASWGNAGWLSPAVTVPLNEPGTLRHGLRGLLKSSSPLYIPPRADPRLAAFLLAFTFNSTRRRSGDLLRPAHRRRGAGDRTGADRPDRRRRARARAALPASRTLPGGARRGGARERRQDHRGRSGDRDR